jgi:hypothetical protein
MKHLWDDLRITYLEVSAIPDGLTVLLQETFPGSLGRGDLLLAEKRRTIGVKMLVLAGFEQITKTREKVQVQFLGIQAVFLEQGPPLVFKSDNGSPFIA